MLHGLQFCQRLFSHCFDLIVQYSKDDIDLIIRMSRDEVHACLQRFSPCLLLRIAEDSGRDQRKADRMTVIFLGQMERVLIGRIQQLWLSVIAILVDWSDRMNNVLSRKMEARRDHGIAGSAASDLFAGF